MQRIEGTEIHLTRGDTLYLAIDIQNENDTPYTPEDGDRLRFVMKHRDMDPNRRAYRDKEPLVEKEIPIQTMILKLDPSDTKPLNFGNYVYDIEFTSANGDVSTIINNALFEVVAEVD